MFLVLLYFLQVLFFGLEAYVTRNKGTYEKKNTSFFLIFEYTGNHRTSQPVGLSIYLSFNIPPLSWNF